MLHNTIFSCIYSLYLMYMQEHTGRITLKQCKICYCTFSILFLLSMERVGHTLLLTSKVVILKSLLEVNVLGTQCLLANNYLGASGSEEECVEQTKEIVLLVPEQWCLSRNCIALQL